MKNFISLFMSLVAVACTAMAQNHSALTFVGKSTMSVMSVNVEADRDAVTLLTTGATTADITIPAKSYEMTPGSTMTIPSFTIHNAVFSMENMVVTFADQTFSETVTVDEAEKTITGSSLVGEYSHAKGTLDLTVKFKYGTMPLEMTYSFLGYYVKSYTSSIKVSVGGVHDYTNESVTYQIRKYLDGDEEKLDVTVPAFELTGTVMGDISLGSYTICGIAYDADSAAYFRDYAEDGLSMYFSNGSSLDGTFALDAGSEGTHSQNIKVSYTGSDVTIENAFQPGAMPFAIKSTFSTASSTTAVSPVNAAAKQSNLTYNIYGQRVGKNTKGIVIRDGKKYLVK